MAQLGGWAMGVTAYGNRHSVRGIGGGDDGLGVPTEPLKAEMRRGLVDSVAERGIDEDEGARASPFATARSWTVVVKPDGSLNDAPALASLDNTVLIDSEKRAS
jgi:hypothetical protein